MFKILLAKLSCPLASAIMQICLLYLAFFYFFPKTGDPYYSTLNYNRIDGKIQQIVNKCGEGSFVSWFVMDGNKALDSYIFREVKGCNNQNPGDNCAYSVREARLNPYYNKESHVLDKASFDFFYQMQTGTAGYYDDMKFFAAYPAINDAINATNFPVQSLSLAVTKNIKSNVVYAFSLVTNKPTKCDRYEQVQAMEELSIFARNTL